MRSKIVSIPVVFSCAVVLISCGKKQSDAVAEGEKEKKATISTTVPREPKETAPATREATPPKAPVFWSEVKLHEAIRARNPGYSGNGVFQIDGRGQVQAIALDNCGVSDLSPLKGMKLQAIYLQNCPVPRISELKEMPLVECYLEGTAVDDLSPLSGMVTLRKLYVSGTDVVDLSPLKNTAITELNLVNTRVSDLTPLANLPLQMLWLTNTKVTDISPLAKCPLVSLTLHRTAVSDLSPLANTRLQRLHIGETPVTDLTPLASLHLTRLVFDIGKIKKGIEGIKEMRSLQELGSKFEDGANNLVPPAQFWLKH